MNELFDISILCILIIVFLRYGATSYPFLFVFSGFVYLVAFPLALNGFDIVTGVYASRGFNFQISSVIYIVFYLIGMRISASQAFLKLENLSFIDPPYMNLAISVKFFKFVFLAITIYFISYSIISRNIFNQGEYLFTILGFDFALICYLMGRHKRSILINLIFFLSLLLLFTYAGFRYRIVILALSELIPLTFGRSKMFKYLISGTAVVGLVIALGLFAQVRSYGSFSIVAVSERSFDPVTALLVSGEQTVAVASMSVMKHIDRFDNIGFEPISIALTHFVPSAIYPDKPRATYIGSYLEVASGLRNTGAAMHDMVQATMMFGVIGLPFSALVLGLIMGFFLNLTLAFSPNRNYAVATIVLFALLIPSRGYFVQQLTWALTFLLPLIVMHYSGRIESHRPDRTMP